MTETELVPTIGAVREVFRDALASDRSQLAAAATDERALGDLVDRLLYRARVDGIELRRDGPVATAVALALPLTREEIVEAGPASAARVADYLTALLSREPLHGRPGWEPERLTLGALCVDLASYAVEAGEPVGARRDLRDARTKADEHSAAQRAEQGYREYDDLITASIEFDRATRAEKDRLMEDLHREALDAAGLTPVPAPAPVTPVAVTPDAEPWPWD